MLQIKKSIGSKHKVYYFSAIQVHIFNIFTTDGTYGSVYRSLDTAPLLSHAMRSGAQLRGLDVPLDFASIKKVEFEIMLRNLSFP